MSQHHVLLHARPPALPVDDCGSAFEIHVNGALKEDNVDPPIHTWVSLAPVPPYLVLCAPTCTTTEASAREAAKPKHFLLTMWSQIRHEISFSNKYQSTADTGSVSG